MFPSLLIKGEQNCIRNSAASLQGCKHLYENWDEAIVS
jgi:hypothetical protein